VAENISTEINLGIRPYESSAIDSVRERERERLLLPYYLIIIVSKYLVTY